MATAPGRGWWIGVECKITRFEDHYKPHVRGSVCQLKTNKGCIILPVCSSSLLVVFLVAIWLQKLHRHQCITAIVKVFLNEFVFYPPTFIQEVAGSLTTALSLSLYQLTQLETEADFGQSRLPGLCHYSLSALYHCLFPTLFLETLCQPAELRNDRLFSWTLTPIILQRSPKLATHSNGRLLLRLTTSVFPFMCYLCVTFVALWLRPYHNNCQSVFSALVWLNPTKIFTEIMWVPLFECWRENLAHEPMNKLPKS